MVIVIVVELKYAEKINVKIDIGETNGSPAVPGLTRVIRWITTSK